MALRTLVKISNVNNLSDARYAAGMGVELIGFNLDYDSENYVSPEEFAAMTSWVSGVKFVGELHSVTSERLLQIQTEYQLDYLQVEDSSSLNLKNMPFPFIFKLDQPDQRLLERVIDEHRDTVEWVLLEFESEPHAEVPDWCIEMNDKIPLIVGVGVAIDSVNEIIEQGFAGIALKGGNEVKPGYRNFDEMADILEALEVDV